MYGVDPLGRIESIRKVVLNKDLIQPVKTVIQKRN